MSASCASPTATEALAVTLPPETFDPEIVATFVRMAEDGGA